MQAFLMGVNFTIKEGMYEKQFALAELMCIECMSVEQVRNTTHLVTFHHRVVPVTFDAARFHTDNNQNSVPPK